MNARKEVEELLTRQLAVRNLRRVHGQLAFAHKGQVVDVAIDQTIYRGLYITVAEGERKLREFRAGGGEFDWDAIAAAIVDAAERRLRPAELSAARPDVSASNRQLARDLWSMIGGRRSSHLSIEPSPARPGRVRVRLQDLDLDPVSVMQLYAAVSRALPDDELALPGHAPKTAAA